MREGVYGEVQREQRRSGGMLETGGGGEGRECKCSFKVDASNTLVHLYDVATYI